MPATPLPATTRYFQPGVSKYYFLPSCANINSPTRVEINAGDDLSAEIAEVSGWMVSSNQIATPDMGTRFESKIPGKTTADDSSITFYGSKDGDDVRAVLPRDTDGFMMICDGGDVPTQPADIFPVTVSSVGKVRTINEQGFQLTISFSITGEPAEDVTIPALT